jgi:uroporphyrinogen-III synthase
MISTSSLQGKKILIPRGKNSSKSFSDIVKRYGGIPVEIPLLDFRPVENNEELQPILDGLGQYDWLILTSKVAVDSFFSFFHDKKLELPKIAVIGNKTAQSLVKIGIQVEFVPKTFVAERFVEEFLPLVHMGDKILIPKGNLARDYIADSLREKGASVDEIIIYETFFPEDSKEKLRKSIQEHELDIIPFTSPSTAEHFMSIVNEYSLHDHLLGCIVACIGPVARERAEKLGLKVDVTPDVYTVQDMVLAIISYLNQVEKH